MVAAAVVVPLLLLLVLSPSQTSTPELSQQKIMQLAVNFSHESSTH